MPWLPEVGNACKWSCPLQRPWKPCLWFCYKRLQFEALRHLSQGGFHTYLVWLSFHYTCSILSCAVYCIEDVHRSRPWMLLASFVPRPTHVWVNPHQTQPTQPFSLNVWLTSHPKLRPPDVNSVYWWTEILHFNVNFCQMFLNVSAS